MTLIEQYKAYCKEKGLSEDDYEFTDWTGDRYFEYRTEMAAQGKFVLNYMNWLASEKYEAEKDRFKAHFVKMHEKEEKEKRDGKGREETPAA